MKKNLALLQKMENFIIIISFLFMIFASFAQVVNRNLIGAGISWFEEMSRYCMVYMALLGTEIGIRDGSQIAITVVLGRFKGVSRCLVDILAKLVVVAFSSVVFLTSFVILEKQVSFGQFSPALKLPMYIPYSALPLSFGIIAVIQAASLVMMIGSFLSGKTDTVKGGAA